MAAVLGEVRLDELARTPELRDVLLRHAYRSVWVQLGLRVLLVVFVALTIGFVPPEHDLAACWSIVTGYVVWAAALAALTRDRGVAPLRWMWLALLVDTCALSALTLVSGIAAEQSWTADVLVNGFYVIPMLAATSLRPMVCAAIALPTLAASVVVSVLTQQANAEPWSSILLRSLVLAGLGAGSVALSAVQLSRVLTIGSLLRERTGLLDDIVSVEAREQALLAENLHDGALQYLLAARQDLEDARDSGDPASFDRISHALRESSTLLRSTVSELHPAVLEQAGLARALADLAAGVAARARLTAELDLADWSEPTAVDRVLFAAAREALTNVAKHAHARTVLVSLHRDGPDAVLIVSDDGRGIAGDALAQRLADGHIGLASHRTRVAAVGGELQVEPNLPVGTRIRVRVPVPERSASPRPARLP